MKDQCDWVGCEELARTADIEHREWNPGDKRKIYCERHSEVVNNARQGRVTYPVCGVKDCYLEQKWQCRFCGRDLCNKHAGHPMASSYSTPLCPECLKEYNGYESAEWGGFKPPMPKVGRPTPHDEDRGL